jgi:hypothetical protein
MLINRFHGEDAKVSVTSLDMRYADVQIASRELGIAA